ncbi:MAG: EAL domain-containing protein [Candidatus Eremiobacteraeota bacterium]|nr:EAL domain-containing protein [Candidatus Eremiobacteraeota bacterium]
MAPRRKHPRPRTGELQKLLDDLPSPLRVVAEDGALLYANRAAEVSFEPPVNTSPCEWQNKPARLEVAVALNPLEGELEQLREKLAGLQRTQRQTARKKRQAESAQRDAERQLQQALSKLARSKTKTQKLEDKIDQQAEPVVDLSADLAKLAKKLEKALKERDEWKAKAEQQPPADPAVGRLEADLARAEAMVDHLRGELEQSIPAELVADLEEELRLVKVDLEEARQAQELAPQLEEATEKAAGLEREVARLTALLAAAQEAPAAGADEGLEEELQQQRAEVAKAERRVQSLLGLNEELNESLRVMRQERETAREREEVLKARLEGLEGLRDELQQTLALKSEVGGADPAALEQLQRQNENLREQLRAATASITTGSSGELGVRAKKAETMLEQARTQVNWLQSRLTETKLDATVADLKQEKAAAANAKETQRLAFEDNLTGLPNLNILKKYLEFALQQASRYNRVVALMVMDLDHFRVVNETMGHQAGNELLRAVATRLKELVRNSDVLARRGEDEFALLLSEIEGRNPGPLVMGTAERILEALSYPFTVQGQRFHLGASIGISLYPSDADSSEALLNQAETAMYQAKDEGRGRICVYTGEFKRWRQHQQSLEGQLRTAVEKNEFFVVYQPVIQLAGRKVIQVEALLRWRHRQMGVLGPENFLETAERSGVLIEIGHRMFDMVANQILQWRQQRLGLVVSINLSHRQLLEPDLGMLLSQVLARHGVSRDQVMLEVREGGQVRGTDRWSGIISGLEREGFKICLDDFGFRESRLTTLARPGIKMVKIEASMAEALMPLVRSLLKDRGIAACIKSVQEKFDHRNLMRLGFDFAQGYAVAEPLEPIELGQKLLGTPR